MKILAQVKHSAVAHEVAVDTAGARRFLEVPAKAQGNGLAFNGGEFLMLALATCCCNDLYREAARLGIVVDAVEVVAEADFDGIGLAASNVRYRARVESAAAAEQIDRLLRETDAVVEVHNTLRAGTAVTCERWDCPAH